MLKKRFSPEQSAIVRELRFSGELAIDLDGPEDPVASS